MSAEIFGELQRKVAHAARGTREQNTLALNRTAAIAAEVEAVQRGERTYRDRPHCFKTLPFGNMTQNLGIGDCLLGMRTRAAQKRGADAIDFVALFEAGYIGADVAHNTGKVAARDARIFSAAEEF